MMVPSSRQLFHASLRLTFFFIVVALFTGAAFGQSQSDAADLRGYVRDQQGAVVANATVTATFPANNSSHTATTNDEGFYQLLKLTPGDHDLTVEAPGFKKVSLPAVKLTLGQQADLDITLEPGQISEVVTISGATTELVETSKTAISTTIDHSASTTCPSTNVTISPSL